MTTSPTAVETKTAVAKKDDDDGKPVDLVDIVMLVLAVASVAGILYAWIWDPPLEYETWFVTADAAICAVFLIEFLFRWHKAGWQGKFPLTHWYEILGMIPILVGHIPIFRAFRFLRIIVITVRLARVVYRVFGERMTNDLIEKVTEPIVEAVKRPITVLVIDEVIGVLKVAKIPLGLSQALRENKSELQQMVLQKLKNDPTTGRLKRVPFHDQIVATVIDTSMRVMFEVLADPRVDEFVSDVIEENYYQIRGAIIEDLDADEIAARYARDGHMKPSELVDTPSAGRAVEPPAPSPANMLADAATPAASPAPKPVPAPAPAPAHVPAEPAPNAPASPAPEPPKPSTDAPPAAAASPAPAPVPVEPHGAAHSHLVSAAVEAAYDEPEAEHNHHEDEAVPGLFDPSFHDDEPAPAPEQDPETGHSAAVQAAIADAYEPDGDH